ncbi:hypothetical protein HLH33_00620 [Gluconacetobacter diazotrophicus]|uniref:Uncharacterized protein n=1 Tax=Gluconacetobacter diazotrophicus TaxID=33996 RepID=A0A7W4FBQ5_GLUDI|nr:hypothetical protein [Gluconacetobacter diazotrophicus]MBB2154823.1 hypothetical protein [Gluconacetobacter diazotrophicus]
MNIEFNLAHFVRGIFIVTAVTIGMEAALYGVLSARTSIENHAAEARIAALVAGN